MQGSKKQTVCSSRTSTFSSRASNFLSSLAPRARAQESCLPTTFLIMILKQVNFWHTESSSMDLDKNYSVVLLISVAHVHSSEMVT